MWPKIHFGRAVLFIFIFLCIHKTVYSQGCSDAGFCTMGAMRPNQNFGAKNTIKLRSVELLQYIGYTKFKDVISTSLADINIGIGKRGSAQIKLPYTTVAGSLGKTQGMGDISYSYTYAVIAQTNYQILATLGGKIPTNGGDKYSSDNRPLPMYYQTSLGTFDGVAGISFLTRNWLLATGFQHAFNANQNEFRWDQWTTSPLQATAIKYPPSWNLKRGNDIMLRIERNFRSTKWNGYLGLLTIYRINKDEISNTETTTKLVTGSTGAAITALAGIGYKFSTKVAVKGMFGDKLLSRATNPDGLSREYVATLSIEIKF